MAIAKRFFVASFALVLGLQAHANPVLWVNDVNGNIGTVDVGTGLATLIGNSGVDLSDIAFDPSGNLYGVSFWDLYRINQTTGAATLVGPLGVGSMNALVFASDGTLYAAAYASTGLYSVNVATGAATLLGIDGYNSGGDLAFQDDNLYLTSQSDQLVRIDLDNLALSYGVGSLGFGNAFGLASADNNTLYGLSGNAVFSINTTTGAGTLATVYGGPLTYAWGATFKTESGRAAEPATAALVALGIVGLAASRRRKLHLCRGHR